MKNKILICNRHGLSEYRVSVKRWKCKKCEYVYSRKFLENLKLKAINYSGGKCQKCNYKKCLRALHFHHIDPSEKEFSIFEGRPGFKKVRSWEVLKPEIDKCILLCANCHTELHDKDDKIEIIEKKNYYMTRGEIAMINTMLHDGRISLKEAEELLEEKEGYQNRKVNLRLDLFYKRPVKPK